MSNSILTSTIMGKGKDLAKEYQKNLDSNFFVLAVLKTCRGDYTNEQISADEMESLKKLCNERFVSTDFAISILEEKVKTEKQNYANTVVFFKHVLNAEAKAKKDQKEMLTADVLLLEILTESTECIDLILQSKVYESEQDDEEMFLKGTEDSHKKTQDSHNESDEESEEDVFLFDDDFEDDDDVDLFGDSKEEELPASKKLEKLLFKVKQAQSELLKNVHGQDHAVTSFISGYFQAELASMNGDDKSKPKAIFLFAGPPGVGKTFLAEQSAKQLGLPFKRFDMSEYSNKESEIEFCGSDQVYKSAKKGNVTSYVEANPKSILLFDEIEKAHINVIHLFLQILDAGRIRDNFTDQEVSFSDSILIFTTNVGKSLYEDSDIENLSLVPRKQVLNALTLDKSPATGEILFPMAICSRFASGNVIMFNRLGAHNLLNIAKRELNKLTTQFTNGTEIPVEVDDKVIHSMMYAEGGNVDARTIKGRTANFFSQEIYELLRLMTQNDDTAQLDMTKKIQFKVEMPTDAETLELFSEGEQNNILVFASSEVGAICKTELSGMKVLCADTVQKAKELLFNNDISLILCDVRCGMKYADGEIEDLLNVEDLRTEGMHFFEYATRCVKKPIYVITRRTGAISQDEALSFMKNGAHGVLSLTCEEQQSFEELIREKCAIAVQQNKLNELAIANKILTFKTKQNISDDCTTASVILYNFKLDMAPDVEDSKSILGDMSRPSIRFDDVIGASDAKNELKYFAEYMKDPVTYMRKGVRAPKGVLLYGPPGTGKTLLAKAMAGESNVTFIVAEGNAFLKSFVGEGPEKVHEYFRLARKYAPSILFIDEIDAIGKNRNSTDGSSSAIESVLTALLTEMDGFKTRSDKPVFVLGATNYNTDTTGGRSLDPALLRRFDRKILIDLPNKNERLQYLRLKKDKNPSFAVSEECLENIAIRSVDMSLADLESVFELALRDSIKSNSDVVDDVCFDNAFESFNSGEVKKWDISELERTARHEAGHALISWLAGDKPSYLTIVARGNHGGYMQHGDVENKGCRTKGELLARIRTSLAGRAAEVVYYGENEGLSTGASSDLRNATRLAESIICYYGMDDTIGLATIDLSGVDGQYQAKIRNRINEILKLEYEKAKELIDSHRTAMDLLVKALLDKNQLKENEIDEILSMEICNNNNK